MFNLCFGDGAFCGGEDGGWGMVVGGGSGVKGVFWGGQRCGWESGIKGIFLEGAKV